MFLASCSVTVEEKREGKKDIQNSCKYKAFENYFLVIKFTFVYVIFLLI